MRTRSFFKLFAIMFAFAIVFGANALQAQSKIWATAYYAGWMQGYNNTGYLPAQKVDYSAMTHIVHFALVPRSDGTLDDQANSVTAFNANELVTRAHAAGKKVIICVGGWATDAAFRGATNSTNRAKFISNLVNLMSNRGYDGIDVDWETLYSSDASQYVAFITELRTALDKISPRPLLAAATAWEPSIFAQVHDKFDQINIMSYDLAGAWPGWVTWHNSPLYDGGFKFPSTGSAPPSVDGMVGKFIAAGIPASKIGIGIDFYGYVWNGGDGTPTGGATAPRQSWTTAPSVQSNVPYYTIMKNYYQPQYYKWDASSQVSYLSIDNAGSVSDKFITYDDEVTVQKKVEYAMNKQIGGVIIWELGGGYRPELPVGQQDPLLQSLKKALGGVTPTLDTTPPTVSLTSPANGLTVSGTLTVSANASDNVGVMGVQFKIDGSALGSEVVSAPYSVSLNTLQLLTGIHTISAVARDAAGNTATASVNVTVSNVSLDTTPPSVSITAPASGATISGTASLTATASDNVAVAGVQFSVDGTNLGNEVTSAPYSTSLNTSQFANGSHTVTATARDAAGNKSSSSVTVTVSNSTPTNSADLMIYQDALQSPWISNSWSATVTYGSTEQVYNGSSSIKTALTSAWGALSLHYGAWGSSTGVDPSKYTTLEFAVYTPTTGTKLSIFAENDQAQTFPKVNPNTLTASQWTVISIPMSQLSPNGYVIHRISIQEISGSTKTYYVDTFRFVGSRSATTPAPDTTRPTVAFTAPVNSATVSGTVAVSANASDNVKVASVRFALDGVNLGNELTAAPYSYSWNTTSVTNGAHTLTATARDSAGNQASTSITVTVSNNTPAPTTDLVVYQDALPSTWINTSWSATATFNSTEQVASGSSAIKVAQSAWGALRLHNGQWGTPTDINTSAYSSFSIAIHGGSTGVSLGVYFENDKGQSFPAVKYVWVAANQWKTISFPISQLNPNGQLVHSVIIQDMSGRLRTFYVDNIRFVGNAQTTASVEEMGTEATQETTQTPSEFGLGQNYPNPFNPATIIQYSLPEEAHVTMEIFNTLGQRVQLLVDMHQATGQHQVEFNGSTLPSGVYFYRLTAKPLSGNQHPLVSLKRMVLTK